MLHLLREGQFALFFLIAIALIALLSGLVIGGSAALLRDRPVTPDEVMRKAISMARRYAVDNMRDVRVAYDAKNKAFVASTVDGKVTYPVDLPGDMKFEFLSAQKGNAILLAGEVVETSTLPYVTFYSDGTCTPFRMQMQVNNNPPHVVAIDPWTCAPILETPK